MESQRVEEDTEMSGNFIAHSFIHYCLALLERVATLPTALRDSGSEPYQVPQSVWYGMVRYGIVGFNVPLDTL